ncbi:MAG: hypothetical protein K5924_08625 [Chloroflexi bacterium]|nr:hypothetical protein [Chloroflexota bacterium]
MAIEHLWWTNRRLLDAAARLPEGAWAAAEHVTTRDLRSTLVHELDVEWSWRMALEGRPESEWGDEEDLQPEDFADVAALRERWTHESNALRDWVASLSDADLLEPTRPGLSSRPLPRWMFVQHLVSHGAQQAADAATLLTAAGASPGDIGFLEYLGDDHRRG